MAIKPSYILIKATVVVQFDNIFDHLYMKAANAGNNIKPSYIIIKTSVVGEHGSADE